MGGTNGPRCLVEVVGVAISAMSTMSWLAMYIEQGSCALPVYYLPVAPLHGP